MCLVSSSLSLSPCLPGRWETAVLAVHTLIQTGPSEDQRAEEAPEQLFPCQPPGEGAVQSIEQWQPL